MTTKIDQAIAETQIRQILDTWRKALHDRDVDAVMSLYAPDIMLFDLAPPLRYKGADTYRKGWEEWFSSFAGPVGYEHRDLDIAAGDDVAFCHSLNRITGARTNGAQTDVWVRGTVGLRKINNRWMITHEHFSAPFDMETYRASLDLKP
jgi:uncharacterized protein (TIGR02246 family)